MYFSKVLVCHSLINSEIKHLFIFLLAIQIFSSVTAYSYLLPTFPSGCLPYSHLFVGVLHLVWGLFICLLYVLYLSSFSLWLSFHFVYGVLMMYLTFLIQLVTLIFSIKVLVAGQYSDTTLWLVWSKIFQCKFFPLPSLTQPGLRILMILCFNNTILSL